MKNWYNVQNKKDRTEVSIYDEIGLFGVSYNKFIDDIKDIDTPLDIHINSPGGSVWDGLAIYDAINQLRKRTQVHTYVDGMAASMAGVLMLASDRIHVAENARFMMHNVWGGGVGDAKELRKTADLLDKEQNKIVNIFTDKMGIPENDVRSLMDEETWYHGQEIIDAGLADVITPSKKIKNTFDIDKYNFKNLKKEEMTNEEKTNFFEEMRNKFTELFNGMKDEKIKDAFAVKLDELDEKIENFDQDYNADVDALNSEIEAKNAEIDELKAQINVLNSKTDVVDKVTDPDPTKDAPEPTKHPLDELAAEFDKKLIY